MENEQFISRLQRRATIAIVLLGLCAASDLAAVALEASDRHLVDKLRAGQAVSLAAATTADNRVHDLGLIKLLLLVATAIAFIAWFSLAYRNLHRLFGVFLRWGNGRAIGSWFVPILSFVRPSRWPTSSGAAATLRYLRISHLQTTTERPCRGSTTGGGERSSCPRSSPRSGRRNIKNIYYQYQKGLKITLCYLL